MTFSDGWSSVRGCLLTKLAKKKEEDSSAQIRIPLVWNPDLKEDASRHFDGCLHKHFDPLCWPGVRLLTWQSPLAIPQILIQESSLRLSLASVTIASMESVIVKTAGAAAQLGPVAIQQPARLNHRTSK